MTIFFFLLSSLVSSITFADVDIDWVEDFLKLQMSCVESEINAHGMTWGVGDVAVYQLSLYVIFKGKLTVEVKEEVPEGFWVDEELDLGSLGEKNFKVLFDKTTGAALRLIVDGEEGEAPLSSEVQVLDSSEEKIQIPAGIFKTTRIQTLDSHSEHRHTLWVNQQFAPFGGLLKASLTTRFGPLQMVALSFKKF